MQSLGMLLRPSTITSKGRIHQYTKILALLTATTILPALYKELKIYRTKQLEEKERLLRYNEIRNEVRTSMQMMGGSGGDSQSSRNSERQHQAPQPTSSYQIIQHRAIHRKRHMLSYLTDTILGLSDVCIPPLRLVTYLSYLWGMANNNMNTPYLGMKLVGWEYAAAANTADNDGQATASNNGQSRHQRHANFQYGNRRLMVEEALRTVSMVVPPRTATAVNNDNNNDNDTGIMAENNARQENSNADYRMNESNEVARQTTASGTASSSRRRRHSWIRNRFLSFMGITEDDNNNPSSSATDATDKRRYTLTCSKCHTINPSIPYIANCGHCYCYICLRMAVTDDLGFNCLDCGQSIISSCRPR